MTNKFSYKKAPFSKRGGLFLIFFFFVVILSSFSQAALEDSFSKLKEVREKLLKKYPTTSRVVFLLEEKNENSEFLYYFHLKRVFISFLEKVPLLNSSAELEKRKKLCLKWAESLLKIGEYPLSEKFINQAISLNTCRTCLKGVILKARLYRNWIKDLWDWQQNLITPKKLNSQIKSKIYLLKDKFSNLIKIVTFNLNNLSKVEIAIYYYQILKLLNLSTEKSWKEKIDLFFKNHPLYQKTSLYNFWKTLI